jgi:hypothetical protein
MMKPSSIETGFEDQEESNLKNNSLESHDSPNKTRRKKKKKKAVTPLSIEDIFNQLSTVHASNLNPPPANVVMTPRSAEVCLKFGVNPEILKIRDIDSFWESGIDPTIQRMRHETYVQRRHETMKQCRRERNKIISAEFKSQTSIVPETGLTSEMLLEQQKQQNSTMISMELQRIEKIKKKQEKEIEQMIAVSCAYLLPP